MNTERKGDDAMKILGLDLSLNSPGYAVIEIDNKGRVKLLECSRIKANSKHSQVQKLRRIVAHLNRVLEDHDLDAIARERGFVRHNKTTQILERVVGAAYGLIGREVEELPPTTIKKLVAGSGSASKEEVEMAVRLHLNLPDSFVFESDDCSDAAAVAIAQGINMGLIQSAE
jgi:crossover junction endodeoxyribonuclease RuvC